MPVYEYECRDCNYRFSRFFWRIGDAGDVRCRCGSGRLEQLVSRVATPRSEESRLDSLADPTRWAGVDESDPRAMARAMKELGRESGEDLGPEFGEVVERLEQGEDPESIETSLSEGGDDAGSADNLF